MWIRLIIFPEHYYNKSSMMCPLIQQNVFEVIQTVLLYLMLHVQLKAHKN